MQEQVTPSRKPRLALAGLAKDCARTMPGLFKSLAVLKDTFDITAFACCSDRKSRAAAMACKEFSFQVLPEPTRTPGSCRYAWMAKLRNTILRAARQAGPFDYYADVCLDAINMTETEGLRRLLSDPDWGAISVMGLAKWSEVTWHIGPARIYKGEQWVYYDTLALQIDGTRFLWECDPGKWYSHGDISKTPSVIFKPEPPKVSFTEWTLVESAYGPLTFYRWSAIEGIEFDEQSRQIELAIFHDDMRRMNRGKHYIAHDILMEYL
jgi:hypothetical protein